MNRPMLRALTDRSISVSVAQRLHAHDAANRLEKRTRGKLSELSSSILISKGEAARKALRRQRMITAVVVSLYIAGGGCVFCASEGWSFINAVYFSVQTMSTVGYGDLAPSTAVGKAFNIIYIVFGVAVVFERLNQLIGGFEKAAMNAAYRKLADMAAIVGDPLNMLPNSLRASDHYCAAIVYYAKGSALWIVVEVAFQLMCAYIYTLIPIDADAAPGAENATHYYMNYGDAVYHGFVTASTVGYGVIQTSSSDTARIWASVHIVLSVVLFSTLLTQLARLHGSREAWLRKNAVLKVQLDEQLIQSLDRDGDGVDQLEFLIGMLSYLDIAQCDAANGRIRRHNPLTLVPRSARAFG